MTDVSEQCGWVFRLGLAMSLALHAGVATYLLDRHHDKFGASEAPTAAVSVELVSSDILDAIEQSQATEAASAPAAPSADATLPKDDNPEKNDAKPVVKAEDEPVEAEPGRAEELERQRLTEEALRHSKEAELERENAERQAREEASKRAEELEREHIAEEALERSKQIEIEREKAERQAREEASKRVVDEARLKRKAEAREAERERRSEERDKAKRQAAKASRRAAPSAAASGSRGAQASNGRVSASQGAIRNYGGVVNAWIARNKPSHPGATGTVVVLLAISPSGRLTSARVVSSSGNPVLDRSALAAVQRSSPFPAPPAGAKPGELVFKYPCYFR